MSRLLRLPWVLAQLETVEGLPDPDMVRRIHETWYLRWDAPESADDYIEVSVSHRDVMLKRWHGMGHEVIMAEILRRPDEDIHPALLREVKREFDKLQKLEQARQTTEGGLSRW